MDLLEVKSRIAEALIESIFRRARYAVAPHRDPMPLRLGRATRTKRTCNCCAHEGAGGASWCRSSWRLHWLWRLPISS